MLSFVFGCVYFTVLRMIDRNLSAASDEESQFAEQRHTGLQAFKMANCRDPALVGRRRPLRLDA